MAALARNGQITAFRQNPFSIPSGPWESRLLAALHSRGIAPCTLYAGASAPETLVPQHCSHGYSPRPQAFLGPTHGTLNLSLPVEDMLGVVALRDHRRTVLRTVLYE